MPTFGLRPPTRVFTLFEAGRVGPLCHPSNPQPPLPTYGNHNRSQSRGAAKTGLRASEALKRSRLPEQSQRALGAASR